MRPLDYPLLADENIGPEVVDGLRRRGCDLRTAHEEHLIGQADSDVLARATAQNRVVLTHDLGFGHSSIRSGAAFVGIIFLRPGHIAAEFALGALDVLQHSRIDVHPPFVIVAERRQARVRVRVRTEPPW